MSEKKTAVKIAIYLKSGAVIRGAFQELTVKYCGSQLEAITWVTWDVKPMFLKIEEIDAIIQEGDAFEVSPPETK